MKHKLQKNNPLIYYIQEIPHTQTWNIRHQVMWPNKSIDFIKLENDALGKHFGLFSNDRLISVISLFNKEKNAQFRKFATIKEEQGKGYGRSLLNFIFRKTQEMSMQVLWCNARKDKTDFYESFGMKKTNQLFLKGGIEFIVMEKKLNIE